MNRMIHERNTGETRSSRWERCTGVAVFLVISAAASLAGATATPATAGTSDAVSETEQVLAASPVAENFDDLAAQNVAVDGNTVAVTGGETELRVELPLTENPEAETRNGLVALSDADSFSIVPAVLDDGSVAIHSVLNDSSAPTTFDYVIDLPTGVELEFLDGGGVGAFHLDGTAAVLVAAPWASDAQGEAVATHYTIAGDTLTQHVEVDATTAFPVVADPWLNRALISYWTYQWYSGQGWRLNVGPTTWARAYTGSASFPLVGEAGWSELSSKMTKTYRARLNLSGKEQYICHMGFAGFDAEWNMELWKPGRFTYGAWIPTKCN